LAGRPTTLVGAFLAAGSDLSQAQDRWRPLARIWEFPAKPRAATPHARCLSAWPRLMGSLTLMSVRILDA